MLDIKNERTPILEGKLSELLMAQSLSFSELTPSKVPITAGVYLISAILEGNEYPYYVGRTKNLQQRLYNNHLMGHLSNARLKKYLIESGEVADINAAKQFLKDFCSVRWLVQDGHRERGAIEGYVTGILFPRHGIYEEH